ncbi:MAG: hypothetical protein NVS1B11_20490 [Terriglobales bacterium]
MRNPNQWSTESILHRAELAIASVMVLLFMATSACSINVKKNGEGEGKRVDIDTPVGGIHVGKDVDARDTGLPVYPGAHPKKKDNDKDDENGANLNISTGLFGVKVVAIEYTSDDPPEKLVSYYQNEMKRFGNVIECHTDKHDDDGDVQVNSGKGSHHSRELKCEGKNRGSTIELKVGTEDNQHLVSITPKDNGSDFGLVYIRTRGEEGSI